MLVQFKLGNYKSIAEPITLSMVAAPVSARREARYIDVENVFEALPGLQLLKTAVIYGPNASGKTNILQGFESMRRWMIVSEYISETDEQLPIGNPWNPNLLIEGFAENPTSYELSVVLNGNIVRYGFEIHQQSVGREWLYEQRSSRETRIFDRLSDGTIKIGDMPGASQIRSTLNPRTLFLTKAYNNKIPIAGEIIRWCLQFPNIDTGWSQRNNFTVTTILNDTFAKETLDLIRDSDVGIQDVHLIKVGLGENQNVDRHAVKTNHNKYSKAGDVIGVAQLDLHENESAGTRYLFENAGMMVNVLKNGHRLSIDEFDCHIHPTLAKRLVKLFQNPDTNPRNAQLIYTTHNANLLDNWMMRRDQIWFADKDSREATRLRSLAEFKIRAENNFEAEYLLGRYGAIPHPGDFDELVAK